MTCDNPCCLENPFLDLPWFSILLRSLLLIVLVRTFQGLLSSNPLGASGLLDCPRFVPVILRSLSITGRWGVSRVSSLFLFQDRK